MSKRKTSSFYLTERLVCTASGTAVTATIDTGSYTDVANKQGLAIEEVDYIIQGADANGLPQTVTLSMTGNCSVEAQLSELNRGGTIQFADDRALISSATCLFSQSNNTAYDALDIYPDAFGAKDGVRIVINDQLYLTARTIGTFQSNETVSVTVRIKAYVCSLSSKDYMALALQSTAADN
tara:strand:- start:461 stop:1003 length:543 start_codon:yes stop_codon:yes gene_type:complete